MLPEYDGDDPKDAYFLNAMQIVHMLPRNREGCLAVMKEVAALIDHRFPPAEVIQLKKD